MLGVPVREVHFILRARPRSGNTEVGRGAAELLQQVSGRLPVVVQEFVRAGISTGRSLHVSPAGKVLILDEVHRVRG